MKIRNVEQGGASLTFGEINAAKKRSLGDHFLAAF
jgi:hypothetical protein